MAIIKIYTALAVAFAALAAAAPAQPTLESRQAGTTEPLRFGGLASRDDSPINLSPINANGLRFVIGKNTTTYTPEGVEGLDPANYNTNQTIFAYLNGFGTLELSSGVPGSQQVYVTEGDEATGQLAGQLRVRFYQMVFHQHILANIHPVHSSTFHRDCGPTPLRWFLDRV